MKLGKINNTNKSYNTDSSLHIIGKERKPQYIAGLALQSGSFVLFDAYGDVTELVLTHVHPEKVLLIEPHDTKRAVAINPLYSLKSAKKLLTTFKSIWGYTNIATPVLDDFLTYALLAILEEPDPNLLKLKWFFTSKDYRKNVLGNVKDTIVRDFWESDFEGMTDRLQQEGTQSTLNKIRAFTGDPVSRHILGQVKPVSLDAPIIIFNAPVTELGENTKLLGSLIMMELFDSLIENPRPVFVNGCNYFAPDTQVRMLDIPGQFVFVHRYLGQLEDSLKQALLGAADLISFRIGMYDARFLQPLIEGNITNPLLHELPYNEAHTIDCLIDIPQLKSGTGEAKKIRHLVSKYSILKTHVEERLSKFIRGMK